MNNVKFQGKTLKVMASNEGLKASRLDEYIPSTELETEERGKLIDKHESRQALMKKLTRDEELPKFPTSVITNEPSPYVYLSNLFDLSEVNLQEDATFFLDIRDEVLDECKEFGEVEDIYVDQTSNGHVWIKFAHEDIEAARRTIEKLDGRTFGGKKVSASFTSENMFNAKTGSVNKTN